jgi:hypothetical protein
MVNEPAGSAKHTNDDNGGNANYYATICLPY